MHAFGTNFQRFDVWYVYFFLQNFPLFIHDNAHNHEIEKP